MIRPTVKFKPGFRPDQKKKTPPKEPKGLKTGQKGKGELSLLVGIADAAFSSFVKNRDAVNGIVKCFTCPTVLPVYQMECGHYAKRGNNKTRWLEQNGHAQCHECNCMKDGNMIEYAKQLDIRYGPGSAENLLKMSKEKFKLDSEFVNGVINQYKTK